MRRILEYLFILSLIIQPVIPANAQIIGAFTQGPAVAATCSYTPPLDVVSGAFAAFSFRLLKTSYSGGNIVTIQRSSDSTQKTFTASTPSCTINTADAFFDSSTYTVVTWYDQSGNGNNVTQGTNGLRPTVTLSCQNGHPCAVFSSASSQTLNATISGKTATTFAVVADITSQAASHSIVALSQGSTDGTGLLYSQSAAKCAAERVISSTVVRGTESCTNSTWYRYTATNNNTLSRIYLNNTAGTDDTSSHTLNSATALTIGSGFTVFMQGNIAEAIGFAPDLSGTDSGTVSTNQGSYWGI